MGSAPRSLQIRPTPPRPLSPPLPRPRHLKWVKGSGVWMNCSLVDFDIQRLLGTSRHGKVFLAARAPRGQWSIHRGPPNHFPHQIHSSSSTTTPSTGMDEQIEPTAENIRGGGCSAPPPPRSRRGFVRPLLPMPFSFDQKDTCNEMNRSTMGHNAILPDLNVSRRRTHWKVQPPFLMLLP